ncbi:HAMP domain-containing protein, partial [Candidatus Dependentiae bacterium]|nr:HAMP domain-containing protein [Candidatus Dependentiae bacterium]
FPEGKQNDIDYTYLESFDKSSDSLPTSDLKLNLEKLIIYYPLIYRKQYVGMLIFTEHLDPGILLQIRMIEKTSTDYRSLIKFGEKSYSFVLNIGFLIVSLVLLFLTFWIAFYVARQITIPVEELLQGTLKVSKGDLDVKIEVETTDELGLLVDSFNNMVRDIKELNIKNQEHTQFISSILQNIGTGVIAITPNQKVVEVNESAKDLLKISSDETPENLSEYFEAESFGRLNKLVDECFKNKTECIHKELDIKVKGKNLNLHFAVTAGIESVSGGAILVFDDITHIIHLQKIEVWKDVATQLAHEIKNPLTPIKLSTQRVLKKYNEGADDFGEILNRSYSTIIQEVDNIKSLLDHFNAFAKLPPPSFQDYSLNQIVSEVVDLFRNLENIKFIEEYDENIPNLSLDKFQIKRVLKNIIDNSIESFLKKGKITISTMFNKSENSALLIIVDNGKGMEKNEREKIFLPYFSTKEIGMGLGMAIVEKIISDHNGEIEVFSQPYKGTKVQIKFF